MWLELTLAMTLININCTNSSQVMPIESLWERITKDKGPSPINLKSRENLKEKDMNHYFEFDSTQIEINTKLDSPDALPHYALQKDTKGLRIVYDGTTEFQPQLTGGVIQNTYNFAYTQFIYGMGEKGSEHTIDGEYRILEGRMLFWNERHGSFEAAKNYIDGILVLVFFGKLKLNDILGGTVNQNLFMEFVQNIGTPGYENFGTEKNPKKQKLPFWYLEATNILNFTRFIYHGVNEEFPKGATYIVFPEEMEMENSMMNVLRSILNQTEREAPESTPLESLNQIFEVANELEVE